MHGTCLKLTHKALLLLRGHSAYVKSLQYYVVSMYIAYFVNPVFTSICRYSNENFVSISVHAYCMNLFRHPFCSHLFNMRSHKI